MTKTFTEEGKRGVLSKRRTERRYKKFVLIPPVCVIRVPAYPLTFAFIHQV